MRDQKRRVIGREEYRKDEYSKPLDTAIPDANERLASIRQISPKRATIAAVYLNEMTAALREMHRVLRVGGYLVLVVANNTICGKPFLLQDYLCCVAEDIGFMTCLQLVDAIRSRGLMTKRNRTAGIITRELVLVFQRGGRIFAILKPRAYS